MSKIMSKTEFIKKHILPYEDAEQQVLWHEGSIGFDNEYLEERATDLNITIMSQDDGQKTKQFSFLNLDRVDDGFNYFRDFRLEELKSDDKYYIESFMDYIEYLETRVDRLSKQLKSK